MQNKKDLKNKIFEWSTIFFEAEFSKSLIYAKANLISKIIQFVSQLYFLKIIIEILSPENASAIVVFLGISPWFFLLEFGMSQTLHNGLKENFVTESDCHLLVILQLFSLYLFFLGFYLVFSLTSLNQLTFFNQLTNKGLAVGLSIAFFLQVGIVCAQVLQRVYMANGSSNFVSILILVQSFAALVLLSLCDVFAIQSIELIIIGFLSPHLLIIVFSLIRVVEIENLFLQLKNLPFRSVFSYSRFFHFTTALSSLIFGMEFFWASYLIEAEKLIFYFFFTRIFAGGYLVFYQFSLHSMRAIGSITDKKNRFRLIRKSFVLGGSSASLVFISSWVIIASNELNGFLEVDYRNSFVVIGMFFLFLCRTLRDCILIPAAVLNYRQTLFNSLVIELLSGMVLIGLFGFSLSDTGIVIGASLSAALAAAIAWVSFKAQMKSVG